MENLEGDLNMKTNDYVRFLTQTFVEHFETPKEERKKKRETRKQQKQSITYELFGILPYTVKESVKMIKKNRM